MILDGEHFSRKKIWKMRTGWKEAGGFIYLPENAEIDIAQYSENIKTLPAGRVFVYESVRHAI